MTKSSTFAKGALIAASGLLALGVAASAKAQPYQGQGYGAYDACQRDANGRGINGALLGGAGGAVIGSQIAASGHRSDGSLLGGVVGAIAGAAIGHSSAACRDVPPPPPGQAYNDAPPPPPPPRGPQAYYEPGPPPPAYGPPPAYVQREVFVYGRHGIRFRVAMDRIGPDGCSWAESPIYYPDGRVDPRWIRVCPDYRGRFHPVY